MIGKLKRSLKERCPDCGKNLQVRVKSMETIEEGIPIEIPVEYISCSNINCGFIRYIEQRRRRRQRE